MSSASVSTFDVSDTIGALFVGEVLVSVLYGISVVQFYSYYRKSTSDHALMRGSMFILFLLDTTHFVGYTFSAWFYSVTNYLNPLVLMNAVHWSLQLTYISGLCGELLVNGTYSFKVYKLGGMRAWSLVLSIQTFVMCIIAVAFGIVYAVRLSDHDLPELPAAVDWLFFIESSLQLAINTEFAFIFTSMLWKMRTGIRRTDSLIQTLMAFTVSAMALPSIVSIGCIIAVAVSPYTLIWAPLLTARPKSMINSLLAFMNSRDMFQAQDKSEPISIHLSRIRFATRQNSDSNSLPGKSLAPDTRVLNIKHDD